MKIIARGILRHALLLPGEATLPCCSGCMKTVARGMYGHAAMLPRKAILRCCSGRVKTVARGMDERTCAYAAREGHLAVLQWAHENGCPWETVTYSY